MLLWIGNQCTFSCHAHSGRHIHLKAPRNHQPETHDSKCWEYLFARIISIASYQQTYVKEIIIEKMIYIGFWADGLTFLSAAGVSRIAEVVSGSLVVRPRCCSPMYPRSAWWGVIACPGVSVVGVYS